MKVRNVVLASALSLLVHSDVSAGTLRGRIVESGRSPLPGVIVEARGKEPGQRSTVTAVDGTYTLSVPDGEYELHFRLLGFARERRQSVQVNGDTTLPDVVLSLAIDADVVVTAPHTFAGMVGVESVGPTTLGTASSASSGLISRAEIESRPALRPGDVLESVPGLLVSQHSGEGKANQFYLRGFNLDHGTDFAVKIAGMPVNLPTHGHGQGYADTNFLIPELVSGVQFRKGPYFAEQGDFSSAGAVNISYLNSLGSPIVKIEGGQFDYRRVLLAGSAETNYGTALYAGEMVTHNGPWSQPEDMQRLNGVLRLSRESADRAFHITALGYDSSWTSADQIPSRAVADGSLSRFDSVDPSDGGETHRYSLSAEYEKRSVNRLTRVSAFALDYRLDVFSNFTYFLEDPVNGDQFEQVDDRQVIGAGVEHRMLNRLGRVALESSIGVELRHDEISEVGLYRTRERERLSTIRRDSVGQSSVALFSQTSATLSDSVRIEAGLRADLYRFSTRAELEENSGTAEDVVVSPKLGIVLGPWRETELYLNAGQGFHSNDGRGAVTRLDPVDGQSVLPADPLVRTRGAEVGLRSSALDPLAITTALWLLDVDSELLFVGDAGTTEASRPSRRWGAEVDASYRVGPRLIADADVAWTSARFSDPDPAGNHIPGSPELVGSMGLLYLGERGTAHMRYRYFGPRPLVESGEIQSRSSGLVDFRLAIPFASRFVLEANVFNLLNSAVSDVDYFYRSRLPGEPADGIEGIHTHPASPRTIRLSLKVAM